MSTAQPISLPRAFWNGWNASTREQAVCPVSTEQADVIKRWLLALGRTDLDIIDVGCGAGWLCAQLTPFGRVTGTDLSNEVLERAAVRSPEVRFLAGDFMELDLPQQGFDVIVTLEVLSHVADQEAFLGRIARLVRPGGHLMIATQNRPALERNDISAPAPGQLRRWVDRHELRAALERHFEIGELISITPKFNRGPLRLLNSAKLRRAAGALGLDWIFERSKRAQERAWLGWTLMALGRKRT
jgi:SAM-dependent methyltransferase